MNKRIQLSVLALLLISTLGRTQEKDKINVVTTLNVLASVVQEIGGEHVTVQALCNPNQDPHRLVAKPTFKAAAQKAHLFIELGLDLDKWAKDVANSSGNPSIQLGQKGRVIASKGIRTKELPETLSKAWGDIHPYGNPHVWLDPLNMKKIAKNIQAGLVEVDPGHEVIYTRRLKDFEKRIEEAVFGKELIKEFGASKLVRLANRGRLMEHLKMKNAQDKLGGWLKKTYPVRGLKIVAYHKTWIYFCDRFGLEVRSEIEEKPGIPPSQTYLDNLIQKINSEKIRVLFIDTFYPDKDGEYISEKTGAKVVSSPIDVGASKETADYFKLIDLLIDRILVAAK